MIIIIHILEYLKRKGVSKLFTGSVLIHCTLKHWLCMYTSVNSWKFHSHFQASDLVYSTSSSKSYLYMIIGLWKDMKAFFLPVFRFLWTFSSGLSHINWWVHEIDHNINTTLMLCSDAAVKVVVLIVIKKKNITYSMWNMYIIDIDSHALCFMCVIMTNETREPVATFSQTARQSQWSPTSFVLRQAIAGWLNLPIILNISYRIL